MCQNFEHCSITYWVRDKHNWWAPIDYFLEHYATDPQSHVLNGL